MGPVDDFILTYTTLFDVLTSLFIAICVAAGLVGLLITLRDIEAEQLAGEGDASVHVTTLVRYTPPSPNNIVSRRLLNTSNTNTNYADRNPATSGYPEGGEINGCLQLALEEPLGTDNLEEEEDLEIATLYAQAVFLFDHPHLLHNSDLPIIRCFIEALSVTQIHSYRSLYQAILPSSPVLAAAIALPALRSYWGPNF